MGLQRRCLRALVASWALGLGALVSEPGYAKSPVRDPPARFDTAASLDLRTHESALSATPDLPAAPQGFVDRSLRVEPGHLPAASPLPLEFPIDHEDLRLAARLGSQPNLSLYDAGRIVLQDAGERLFDPYALVQKNFRERPLTTGVALGVGIAGYVGWESLNDGRLSATYHFKVGDSSVSVSGSYDLQTGAWAGRARFDLSRLVYGN
jgi:hypothetical protein